MPSLDHLLDELRATLSADLHTRLLDAYRGDQTYEALLAACNSFILEKVNEIEDTDS